MEKRLIINADDFGLCHSVNKGIVEAHTNGVLTSATLMANMPAADEAVELAKKLPHFGVGVHLNLTNGKPLSKNIDCLLKDDGNFKFKPAKLALMSMLSAKVRTAIETELASQIQWVIQKGIKPTHLDTHKHISGFPTIFPIICRLAKRFAIHAIRYTFEPKQVSQPPWPEICPDGIRRARMVRTMAKITHWQNPSFFKTKALLGVAHTGIINVNFFQAVSLYNTISIAEVMTHPGYTYDLDKGTTRLISQREAELEALCSEKTKQYLNDAKIKLVNYGEL